MQQQEFTRQAEKVLELAKKAAQKMKHNYIGTEHILYGLITEEEGTAGKVLRENGMKKEALEELIQRLVAPPEGDVAERTPVYSPRSRKVLEYARELTESFGEEVCGTEMLLLGLLKENDSIGARLLWTSHMAIPRLLKELFQAMGYSAQEAAKMESEFAAQGHGGESADTPMLDKFSRDLTLMAEEGRLDPVVGREAEIGRIIQILSRRTKNNPCLVGEPGVGKTAIAEGLAQRIVAGNVPETVADKRIVVLDLSGMVAGTKYRGEFEERIKSVIQELEGHREILLFIDELHTIIGAGGSEGSLDAAGIMKPALSRGEIQIIGATTREEYRKYIEKDAALERRFQPVAVEEPTMEQAVEILKGLRPYYEKHHKVSITDEALKHAVRMSKRYITDRFLPDKAIDVIDEAASRVRIAGFKTDAETERLEEEIAKCRLQKEEAVKTADLPGAREAGRKQKELEEALKKRRAVLERKEKRNGRCVDEDAVAEIISQWTGVPVAKLTEGESRRLTRLEAELHKRVIGQEEAVKAVAQAVRRGRVGLKDPSRPIGSFLFLGPTGVGKTELSKALAEAVFGSEQNMIRMDMSEYMEKHTVSRLIGSPPGYVGYEDAGQLSEKVRRNPYSVILFDEIEKAHPDVFNILLQVLDDGHITDAHGRKVDFKQTIIIMTSNAGARAAQETKSLGFSLKADEKQDYEKMKSGVMAEVKRIFRPEFLNRIDETIIFHSLGKEEIRKIVGLMLNELSDRCMEQMDIALKVTPAARDHLCEAGFDPKYGARPLRRAIQTEVENALAEEILSGRAGKGDGITVSFIKGKMVFNVKKKTDKPKPEETEAEKQEPEEQLS